VGRAGGGGGGGVVCADIEGMDEAIDIYMKVKRLSLAGVDPSYTCHKKRVAAPHSGCSTLLRVRL